MILLCCTSFSSSDLLWIGSTRFSSHVRASLTSVSEGNSGSYVYNIIAAYQAVCVAKCSSLSFVGFVARGPLGPSLYRGGPFVSHDFTQKYHYLLEEITKLYYINCTRI